MVIWNILITCLFIVGIFFIVAGVVGILRMPDTFCRLQSATNVSTMGAMPIALGCSIWGFVNSNNSIGIKALVILFFLIITNPVVSHVMARTAYKIKIVPSNETKFDHYGRDINE